MILKGIRVIEVGQILAAPFAGSIFADMGAEVIKVERPEVGDDSRTMGRAFLNDDSILFHAFNRGKRSVVIDLKTEEGVAELHSLADDADILVHNLRPGVAAEIGIDGETFRKAHPKLIYCEISGFGPTGPLRDDPAYELLIQAFAGLISINGNPGSPQVRIPISCVDLGTSMWTVIGALGALVRRQQTGEGGTIQTSLFETALSWLGQKINPMVNQDEEVKRVSASAHGGMTPYQSFEASDGSLVICVSNDRLFARMCRGLGREEWIDDPRFNSNRQRIINGPELTVLMQELLSTRPRAEWVARLREVNVPCAPVNEVADAVASEQFVSTGMLQKLPDADVRLIGLPILFDGERPDLPPVAPRLGQHTERYLGARRRAAGRSRTR